MMEHRRRCSVPLRHSNYPIPISNLRNLFYYLLRLISRSMNHFPVKETEMNLLISFACSPTMSYPDASLTSPRGRIDFLFKPVAKHFVGYLMLMICLSISTYAV